MSSESPKLRPATVRRDLEALRDKQLVPASMELTHREPLADFLRGAATELGFGSVTVNAELSMRLSTSSPIGASGSWMPSRSRCSAGQSWLSKSRTPWRSR